MTATRSSGVLTDGTAWRAIVPDNWSGILISDADLTDFAGHAAFDEWCELAGHAIVRTSREPAAWQVGRMLDNRHRVHEEFVRRHGVPATIVATGESLGGMVSRAIAERDTELADVAVAMNGGGSGTIALWNAKLDAAFALDVLVGGERGHDGGPDLARIQQDPAGRARATLAAAFAMQPSWSDPAERPPAPDDRAAQAAVMRSSLGFGLAPAIRAAVEELAGGVFSGNEGVDYVELGNRLGSRQAIVAEEYERAGLSLDADLAMLNAADRIATDDDAVRWAEAGVWSGELKMPLVTLYAIGDPAAVPEEEAAYAGTVARAGADDRLQELYLDAAGHCQFTAGERGVAVDVALRRLRGVEGIASVTELREAADAADAELSRSGFAAARRSAFVDYRPEPYLRPRDRWDA